MQVMQCAWLWRGGSSACDHGRERERTSSLTHSHTLAMIGKPKHNSFFFLFVVVVVAFVSRTGSTG